MFAVTSRAEAMSPSGQIDRWKFPTASVALNKDEAERGSSSCTSVISRLAARLVPRYESFMLFTLLCYADFVPRLHKHLLSELFSALLFLFFVLLVFLFFSLTQSLLP